MSKSNISVLFVGESWFSHTVEVKGFDQFTVNQYNEGTKWIKKALDTEEFSFTHVPSHIIHQSFPDTLEELQKFDVVFISDVGANTFLLHPETFFQSKTTINKLNLIKEYVSEGGAMGMIGGYMSFQGIDGKAKYKGTAIEEILPVTLMSTDDRMEIPEGINLEIDSDTHEILNNLPSLLPPVLGYNKLKAKAHAEVLVSNGEDPIIAVGEYGKGRTLAYATDCSPHWASPEFCNWEYYSVLWQQSVKWLANK